MIRGQLTGPVSVHVRVEVDVAPRAQRAPVNMDHLTSFPARHEVCSGLCVRAGVEGILQFTVSARCPVTPGGLPVEGPALAATGRPAQPQTVQLCLSVGHSGHVAPLERFASLRQSVAWADRLVTVGAGQTVDGGRVTHIEVLCP